MMAEKDFMQELGEQIIPDWVIRLLIKLVRYPNYIGLNRINSFGKVYDMDDYMLLSREELNELNKWLGDSPIRLKKIEK